MASSPAPITLTGNDLEIADLAAVASGAPVVLSDSALEAMGGSRAVVDGAVTRGEVVYGVNTGFGNFADVRIGATDLEALQRNLVRSHAAGVGPTLPTIEMRALMVLRANVLAKGFSGARVETAQLLIDCVNGGIHPRVPEQGSVGASSGGGERPADSRRLTQIFVDRVQAFYVRRAAQAGAMGAKTGAITPAERSDCQTQ